MDKIFNLIKLKKFKNIKEYIINNEAINLNEPDAHSNYLIHYVIIYNQIDLLNFILQKNINITILDIEGNSILYIPIKFNYLDIVELIIIYDQESIGVSITEIKDNKGYTPYHYCIIFNNLECLKLLLKYNNLSEDILVNLINMSIKKNLDNIIFYLIKKINVNNNSCILHLSIIYNNVKLFNYLLNNNINLDYQEEQIGLYPIHQCILYNLPEFTKQLINKGCNINSQTFFGRTSLMNAISSNYINIINLLFSKSNLNYNLVDLNSKTGLHLIFENYNYYSNNIDLLNKIIKNTDLNIQDNDGNTCLLLLTQKKLLDKFKNILQKKKLNIFINNHNNINVYSLIKNSNNHLDIIAESYYYNLQSNKPKDLEEIKQIIIKTHNSLPKFNTENIILENGIFVNTCYYTGLSIDILFGLLFLYNTFKNLKVDIILDYPLVKDSQFDNFEILWKYQTLIIPTYLEENIKKKIKTADYIIISIGIIISRGSHANILFYNVKKSTIERFEPNGSNFPKDYNYNPVFLDTLLEKFFKNIDSKIKLIKPNEYLPIIGFQILENTDSLSINRIGDPNGFCGVWCIWWIYHKIKNINIDTYLLADILIKEIKFKNNSFKTIIRNFSNNITELRDNFLKKYNLNINDFASEKYDNKLIIKLEKDIINYIK